jgi:hypothetical protein
MLEPLRATAPFACRLAMTDSAAAHRSAPPRARCPRCGRIFDCGAHSQPFVCWCAAMPGLPAGAQPALGARCLCPECLADDIARRVSAAQG